MDNRRPCEPWYWRSWREIASAYFPSWVVGIFSSISDGQARRARHVHISISWRVIERLNGCSKATDLADCLEHSNSMFEITYMKYRDNKFDVCIMTNTIDRWLSTSFTVSTLFCSSLERKVRWGGGIPIHIEDSLPDDDRALHFWQAGDPWRYRDRDVSLQIQIFWQCPVHSKDWTAVFYYLRLRLIHQK